MMKRKCDNCQKEYKADERNLKRGWGLCCSKSCAAKKREKSKPGYDPETVKRNNHKRIHGGPSRIDRPYTVNDYNNEWGDDDQWGDCDIGIK